MVVASPGTRVSMPRFVLDRAVGIANAPYVIAALDAGRAASAAQVRTSIDEAASTQCDAIRIIGVPDPWCARVIDHAHVRGITLIASVSNERAIERLDWLGVHAFEVFADWIPPSTVAAAASTGRPLILSVANARPSKIARLVAAARREQARDVAVLQRISRDAAGRLDANALDAVTGVSMDDDAGIAAAIEGGVRIVERRVGRLMDSVRAIKAGLSTTVRACDDAWIDLGYRDSAWRTN